MPTSACLDQRLLWFARTKYDDWWRSQMPITDVAMAGAVGMLKGKFSESIHNKGNYSDRVVARKMDPLIADIERRALVFPKEIGAPKFLWLEPPAIPPRIPKYDDESAWSLWAECQRCQKNKFLPAVMNGKPQVMCYYCLPPKQYPALGAKRVEKSLIHAALKKYY
jgi:hypothetical protein